MSDLLDQLAPALVAAQAEFGVAVKNKTNSHLRNSYADLAAIWDCASQVLHKHGLSVIQGGPAAHRDGCVSVETTLLHTSGQFVTRTFDVAIDSNHKGINLPQATGVAITYGRRYGLSAMLMLMSDDDTDGEPHGGRRDVTHEQSPPVSPLVTKLRETCTKAFDIQSVADDARVPALRKFMAIELDRDTGGVDSRDLLPTLTVDQQTMMWDIVSADGFTWKSYL